MGVVLKEAINAERMFICYVQLSIYPSDTLPFYFQRNKIVPVSKKHMRSRDVKAGR